MSLWQPIWLTLALATLTTLILLVIGTPVAWWLARSSSMVRDMVTAVVCLPVVLPPTVLGFYLLLVLGPSGPGRVVASLWGDKTLAFTFPGLVIGSTLYSMPFVVQPLRNAFVAVGRRPLEVAATLGARPWQRFWHIAMPLAKPGFVTAAILGFAHTVGEFGIVMMVGGNIPGRTRVVSLAIFDAVEEGDWLTAHALSAGLVVFSFVVILSVTVLGRFWYKTTWIKT